MKCEFIKTIGTWRDVADAARTTVGMEPGTGEPSDRWKKNMLLAQHSPIRQLMFRWRWVDIPYWVSVHLVRHSVGITHFVRSQRTDRTGVSRDELPQNAPVIHECLANAEAIMFISRRRLCMQASKETRDAWSMFLTELQIADPVLASCCVPECIYRGFCPELKPCGMAKNNLEWEFLKWNYRDTEKIA